MATPYFLSKPIIEKHKIATFSSNYNLYGELSRRVMDTVQTLLPKGCVEVYSVDEAFLDLSHIAPEELRNTAIDIKERVEQWTGISVSIGVAPTKTLAKVANHIAKKNKEKTGCVMVLDAEEKIADALNKTKVRDVWGVGSRKAVKLENIGIADAWQLKQMPEAWARKHLGGVVGVRLIKELCGEEAVKMDKELTNKKMITTTRMFGQPVTQLSDVKEAVATYTSRAAEKLRRQQSSAKNIYVFVVPKVKSDNETFSHGPMVGQHIILPYATSVTNQLIKPALQLAERLFEPGKEYKKAGVILSGLEPDETIQGNLFASHATNNQRLLMDMIDNVNFSMRNDILKFGASGTEKNWKMRQELRSPRYTTRWKELREVK